jgi:hypothetical protein
MLKSRACVGAGMKKQRRYSHGARSIRVNDHEAIAPYALALNRFALQIASEHSRILEGAQVAS